MSGHNIDPWRRAEIEATFPVVNNVRPMAPVVSTQVRAMDRAEAIVSRAWPNGDRSAVFDQSWCPPMAARADAAAEEFRQAVADGLLRSNTEDKDFEPDHPAEQGVVRIWFVGSRTVDVVRERWKQHPNRLMSTSDYFGAMYGLTTELHDYRPGFDHDPTCTVGISEQCGGPTRLLPANRGTLVLLFWCCRGCETLAGNIADETYRRHVIDARADLPPGAIIMPNPTV